MTGLAVLLAAEKAAEAEASESPAVDLAALAGTLWAGALAAHAVLGGNRARASSLLKEAAATAGEAFAPASRESYGLTLVLGAITEEAGAS